MNVLSYFDGMSCGQIALNRQGIAYDNYFACETDKFAKKVTQANYPNTKQLGCVTKVFAKDLPKIDLFIGGSPCQGFSYAGTGLNFEHEKSKLFFEYVRMLNELKKINPNVKFLLENVEMKKEYEAIISRYLGIDPIKINSSLVSAQSRKRLYWTNIGTVKTNLFGLEEPGIKQPKNKRIFLKDILETDIDEEYYIKASWAKFVQDPVRLKKKYTQINGSKAITMTARQYASWGGDFIIQKGHGFNNGGAFIKKSPTLTSGNWQHQNHVIQLNKSKESNGAQPYQQNRVYSELGLSPCLDGTRAKKILSNQRIRRLTPVECERLQTVPDNYTNHVSNTQRYKMLGNGWTVDVICHILSYL